MSLLSYVAVINNGMKQGLCCTAYLNKFLGVGSNKVFNKQGNLISDMLCISTSERVLLTPFAGRNRLFDAKTTISVTNGTK